MFLDEAGLVAADRMDRLTRHLAASDPEDADAARHATALFAAMLTDVPVRAVAAVLDEVWARQRTRVFDFAGPLVAALTSSGYVPMLISGGPQDLVARLAAELGVERFRGVSFEAAEGLYTGSLATPSPVGKQDAAVGLAGGDRIEWSRSLAVGDSLGDASVLRVVGAPVAFEPSPALRRLAGQQGWSVCDRHSLLSLMRDREGLVRAHRRALAPARPGQGLDPSGRDVARARERLTGHLLAQVGARGAVAGETEGRVTESALMFTLLRRSQVMPALQLRLRAYLAGERAGADAFDRAVIDAAVSGIPVTDRRRLIERTFAGAAVHSSARKKLALEAILALVGPEPFRLEAPSDAFGHRNEATWTWLRQIAIHHLHVPDPVAPELTVRLERAIETGQRDGIIEGNVFAHLFALLSLRRAAPGHRLIGEGTAHLAKLVRPDGAMPFIRSEEIFATATAGLALSRAGVERRVLLAMGDYLAGQQAPDGGWAYAQDVAQTDVDSAAHAVILLHTLGPERYRNQIGAARRYLTDLAGDDGGMPTYLPGQPSEPTMTANTITALGPYHFAHAPLLHTATEFLLRAQKPDGTFERSWSLSESNAMMRAHAALSVAHGHNPAAHSGRLGPALEAIRCRLLTTANSDGGWGQTPGTDSDPMSTAYTLTTLAATRRHHPTVQAGLRHLLERQDGDGGYRSVSDQAAPRPLRYSVPVLTDIFVLLALTYAH